MVFVSCFSYNELMSQSKIHFYKTISGKETILDFLDKLNPPTLAKTRNGIRLLENYGLSLIKTKWVKKINHQPKLFELRITGKKQIRLLFCPIQPNTYLITNVFIKKTKKTPKKEIKTAIQRSLEFL